jgi:hypothetical protein
VDLITTHWYTLSEQYNFSSGCALFLVPISKGFKCYEVDPSPQSSQHSGACFLLDLMVTKLFSQFSKSSDLVESRAAHQLWFSISLVLTDAETFSHECISQVLGGKLVSCQQLQDWALEEARELGCWYGKVLSTYWHILLLDIDAEFGLCMSKYWVNGSFVVQLRRQNSSTVLVSSWQSHQILCCW